jgi:hypothetical protein
MTMFHVVPLQAAGSPSAVCTNGLTRLDRQLGGSIPLPSGFSNPTSSTVRFTMRLAGSSFFGPARDVASVTLAAGVGRTYAGVLPTFLHTPLGVGNVVIEVRTDRTGDQVVGRCEYQLHLAAPPPVMAGGPLRPVERWLFQVPVQMCAIEGSDLAGTATAGQTVLAGKLLETLAAANNTVWYPQAGIAFSTATDSRIPVIRDPSPPNGTNGQLGDLEANDFYFTNMARDLCRQAWQARFPGRRGIPVINARSFRLNPPALGVSPPPPAGLYVPGSARAYSGTRGDALCGSPIELTTADVSNLYVAVFDQARLSGSSSPVSVLAHELGHNLFLGHGNGLDDDGDGRPAGFAGPRRYDEICDPDWLVPGTTQVAEDVDSSMPCSLMQVWACSTTLRPLQTETARGVALFIPGAVDGQPPPVVALSST